MVAGTSTYTFPISFSTHIWGIGFSQSGGSSYSIPRIAITGVKLSQLSVNGTAGNTTNNGAYFLAIGY